MGVIIDAWLSFGLHLKEVFHKAEKVNGGLMQIMSNTGDHKQSRHRLLASVVQSIILYGAAKTCYMITYRRKLV